MKKILLIVVVLLLLFGGAYVYQNFLATGKVNLIREKIAPANKELLSLGEDLETALTVPAGTRIGVFADLGEGRPRVLTHDPNGVLVSSLTSAGSIVALPDEDGNGISDRTIEILTGLAQPHGVLFSGNYIYVAETNQVVRYAYDPESFKATSREVLLGLPYGEGHFTRTIKVYANKLYTSVGSSCNVCEETNDKRSTIVVSDLDGKNSRIYASGLRNTVFFTFDAGGAMWGNDMGRDLLGDKLPPDELNKITEGNYGWPYCYGKRVRDANFGSISADYCESTIPSEFDYPAHVAPLGITFINSNLFGLEDQGDILAAFHGSWNSSSPVGYKVVKLDVSGGRVTGMTDFITGFISGREVIGRPVDLLFDEDGYLYISDDKSGLIYVVSKE